MNERIRKLAEQTGLEYNFDPMLWLKYEKFAELIVRECSKVIVNGGYWSGGSFGPKRQCTPLEIAQMIIEHFGFKE